MAYRNRRGIGLIRFIRVPSGGSNGKKELEYVEVSEKLLFPVSQGAGKGHGRSWQKTPVWLRLTRLMGRVLRLRLQEWELRLDSGWVCGLFVCILFLANRDLERGVTGSSSGALSGRKTDRPGGPWS